MRAATGVLNFLFVDRVPADLKPTTAAPDPGGIKVEADSGSNATLRIETKETNNDDRSFEISQSTTSDTMVRTTDIALNDGDAHIGIGVTNLVIHTPDISSPTGHWPPAFPNNLNPGSAVTVTTLATGIHLLVNTGAGTYEKVTLGDGSGSIAEQVAVVTGAGRSIVTTRGLDIDHCTHALVDFGERSTLGNNRLDVNDFSTVTLAQAVGSSEHVIVVEDANVDGGPDKPAILYVADESTIDDLTVLSWGEVIVSEGAHGTEIPIFLVNAEGAVAIASIQGQTTIGTLTNEGYVEFTASSAPSTVDQFKIGSTTTLPDSSGHVTLDMDAVVTILAPTPASSPSRIGELTIKHNALLRLQAHPTGEDARVLGVGSVFIYKSPAMPHGTLDLTDNAMMVDYTGASPFADTRAYITSAYNGGGTNAWTGKGITTSLGDATTYALGYAENDGTSSGVGYTSFAGQNVDGTSVLVRYTYYGDANVDGTVNLLDFNRLAANFGGSNKVWAQGDFTYDLLVNLQDFNRLAANFGRTGLGDAGPEEVDEYTYEELEEMLENYEG